MIGLPGVGKTTQRDKLIRDKNLSNYVILSTDDYIESLATSNNITYNEAWKIHIKAAEKLMLKVLDSAIENGQNIIWDQTNLNSKTRRKKLNKVPNTYTKTAVHIKPSSIDRIHQINEERLSFGRNIPKDVLSKMIFLEEDVSPEENFQIVEIITI
jgi:tRNA uridine 5-carbamoylmethylation protein Kti12